MLFESCHLYQFMNQIKEELDAEHSDWKKWVHVILQDFKLQFESMSDDTSLL